MRGLAAGTSGVLLLPVCSKSHLLEAQPLVPAVQWTQGERKDLWICCQVVLDYAYVAVPPSEHHSCLQSGKFLWVLIDDMI